MPEPGKEIIPAACSRNALHFFANIQIPDAKDQEIFNGGGSRFSRFALCCDHFGFWRFGVWIFLSHVQAFPI
jgi:hypothetical protein